MAIVRRLAFLVPLIIATGLLSSCVPIPPYDPVLAQSRVYDQQEAQAIVQPTVIQTEPTSTLAILAQVEPTGTPVMLAQAEPTGTPETLARIEPTGTPVTVTISLVNPSDAQVLVVLALTETPVPTLTPTPFSTATSMPTSTPRPTSMILAKSTRAATATRAATSTRAPTPTATVDQHFVMITEADIAKAVAAGAGAQQGMTVENLKVRFADGKTHITADKLGYGIIKMQNLDLVGRLGAQNGVLSLAVESISPRGLAANFVPVAANQALANFASQWYVEEVRTLDGRVELRIR